ncbi:MAG: dTMP kinase [Tepidisphaeraceae bacterium]|jgi:dTMP kinase
MTSLRGKFIVFDGNEGCGKSTQARMLLAALEKSGVPAILVRDPGSTRIGEIIRNMLLDPQNTDMSMRCEMLLYMAARAQMMSQIVQPALEQGRAVVSDRFISSTLAYQLGGDGLTEADILAVGQVAIDKRWPDMTIILDLPVSESNARARPKFTALPDDPIGGAEKDRIELRSLEYHEKVRENYLRQSKIHRGNYRVVDAGRDPQQVHAEVMRLLSSLKPEP